MKRVTLTFDNGPTPGITDKVLDILDRAGLRCIFFVVGDNLQTQAGMDLMRAAHDSGHRIGNHTLTHSVPLGARPEAAYAIHEIEETQRRIARYADPARLFRPFGNQGRIGPHLLSRAALRHLLDQRYTTILWTSVPGDFRDPNGWVETCLEQIDHPDTNQQDWAVTVLHDIETGCLKRLPELLGRLNDRGVTITQALPEAVVLTRDGRTVSLDPGYVADCEA